MTATAEKEREIEKLADRIVKLDPLRQRQVLRLMRGLQPTFRDWNKSVWPKWNWDWMHLQVLMHHLELVLAGLIKRLIIEIPIRHGKSETVSSRFPVFALHDDPSRKIILGSYGKELAVKFGRHARDYAELTGLKLNPDRSAAHDWETMANGGMRSVGVGVGVHGHGGDIIIIDDPIKSREEAESEAYRDGVWEWFKGDLYSRLEPNAALIVMAARQHEDDLIGRITDPDWEGAKDGEWVRLKLPGIAQENDPLGREEGEALCPDRFPIEVLNQMRLVMGDYIFSSLVQQEPTPKGGKMFPRDKVRIIDAIPAHAGRRLRYWDKAATKKKETNKPKFTAGVKMSYIPLGEHPYAGCVVVEHVVRGQWEPDVRNAIMKQTAQMERGVKQIHEQEPGSGGKESAQFSTKLFGSVGSGTEEDRVTGDKILRMDPFSSQWKAGNVLILRGDWNEAYLNEMEKAGPGANFLDQADASSGAFNKMMLRVVPRIRGV
jgi:predicted phage terminase large subunit-like protein